MRFTHYCSTLALKTVIFCCFVGFGFQSFAKEGMWLPPTLKGREKDMQQMGLEIPVDMLYNENGTSINNAIVLFGKGCTGEVISSKGLVLTNHHCGYGTVQGLSSKDADYFANGFWAMDAKGELPCPGLTVTFIRKLENVSDRILFDIPDTMADTKREEIITGRIKALEKGFRYTTGFDAVIKPYFNGNQYWVIITETYSDIRLVGFPPNGIGQFGGDTDNWMWPRHTGDFSMFRIYASKDNKPAAYSKNNKPYTTKNFLTINAGGYKEGDFTMVYGFPGTTQEYISSYQLQQINEIIDPIRIAARTKKLQVWTKHMTNSRDVFLKYTSKRASVANGWKKWQGEVRGLALNNVSEKKQAFEHDFQGWANDNDSLPYASDVLSHILANTTTANNALRAEVYLQETVNGIELLQQAATLDKMLTVLKSPIQKDKLRDTFAKLAATTNSFYKNFDLQTDKELFTVLMAMYVNNSNGLLPLEISERLAYYGNDYNKWADDLYSSSILLSEEKLAEFANSASKKDINRIITDPAWVIYSAIMDFRKENTTPIIANFNKKMNYYNRLYMKAQMTMDNNKMFYPDANLTLRLTYGKIKGLDPDGAAPYSFQTNLNEVIAKNNPEVEEFNVPSKLINLHQNKDYGRWAVNGTVPVAFIASNHTSGGNSGSPVLNGKGQLIGTNFDRVWEGTMSDLYFDPNLCRNISLDIRYTLFIIEKFGNAGWLLKEMKIVNK